MTLATVASVVSIAGGVKGLLDDGGGGGGQASASREPWGPAQPWLKEQISRGQALQNFYQQNPFGAQQKVAYQNLFGDIDNYRNMIMPTLLGTANSLITQPYQRSVPSAPGMGMYQRPAPRTMERISMPGQNFGLIDWSQFTPSQAPPPAPEEQSLLTDQDKFDEMYKEYLRRQAANTPEGY